MKGYTRLFRACAIAYGGTTAGGSSTRNCLEGRRLVKGVVQDTKGATIPGATIIIKGTDKRRSNRPRRAFSFYLAPRRKVLVVSYIGMKTREVNVAKGESTLR